MRFYFQATVARFSTERCFSSCCFKFLCSNFQRFHLSIRSGTDNFERTVRAENSVRVENSAASVVPIRTSGENWPELTVLADGT